VIKRDEYLFYYSQERTRSLPFYRNGKLQQPVRLSFQPLIFSQSAVFFSYINQSTVLSATYFPLKRTSCIIPMKILQSKQAPSRGNKITELLGKTSCVQLVKMKSSTLFVLVLRAVLVMGIFAAVAKENGTCMLLDTESFTEVTTVCKLGRSFFFSE
jgi:hypothetical protein